MALKFTSTNSYVDLGTSSPLQLNNNAPFTFETWIQFQAFRDYAGIFSKNNGLNSPYTYMLVVHANGTMSAYNGSAWVTSSDTTKALQLNTLYHIAYVYDGTNLKYYINEQLVGQVAFTYTNNITYNCKIGSWYSSSYYPSAIMDGCRFWNVARTQQQLIDNKYNILGGNTTGLVGEWDFQNVTSNTIKDYSINNITGTVYGCSVETNLVALSYPVYIEGIDIAPSNIWYSDIDNVNVRFKINSSTTQNVKYNVKINDVVALEENTYSPTPTDFINLQIPKNKFSNVSNGKITELGNVIPTMTSYSNPSGLVTSSTEYDTSNYQAWRAFDKTDTQHGWITQSGVITGWIGYEFPMEQIIVKYRIKAGTYLPEMPKTWTFEGYDLKTSTWEVLHSLSDQPAWSNNEWRDYSITNTKAYRKYRINITANNGGSYTGMNEIEMIGAEIEVGNKLTINTITNTGISREYNFYIKREDRDTLEMSRTGCYPSEWIYYNKEDFQVKDNIVKLANLKQNGIVSTSNFNRIRTTGKRKILNCKIDGEKMIYYKSTNMLPVITNYTQSGYTISASTQYDTTSYNAWKAFNQTNLNSTDCWITQNGAISGWLQIQLPSSKRVGAFAISNRNNAPDYNYSPKDFQLLGSNDGINFNILKSVTSEIVWKSNDYKFYVCDNVGDYLYYRLNITSNVAGNTYVAVSKLELFEYQQNVIERVEVVDDVVLINSLPDGNGIGKVYEYDLRLDRFTDVLGISIV